MKIVFTAEGDTLSEVVAEINLFLSDTTIPIGAAPPEAKPAKRKRRTKAEMAEARHEEQMTSAERIGRDAAEMFNAGAVDPTSPKSSAPRRGRRSTKSSSDDKGGQRKSAGATDDASATPGNRRRGSAASTTSLSDADLAMACSALAQATTPGVVQEYMNEFGVESVTGLQGDARREFLTAINLRIEEET